MFVLFIGLFWVHNSIFVVIGWQFRYSNYIQVFGFFLVGFGFGGTMIRFLVAVNRNGNFPIGVIAE